MAKRNSNLRPIGRKVETYSPSSGVCTINSLRHSGDESEDESIKSFGQQTETQYTPVMHNELSDIVRQRCEGMGRSVKDSSTIASLLSVIIDAPSEKLEDVARAVNIALDPKSSSFELGKRGPPPNPVATEARLREQFRSALIMVSAAKSDAELIEAASPLVRAHDRLRKRGAHMDDLGGQKEVRNCRRVLRAMYRKQATPK